MQSFQPPTNGRLAFSTGALTDHPSPNDINNRPTSPSSFWRSFGLRYPRSVRSSASSSSPSPPSPPSSSSASRHRLPSPSNLSSLFSQYSAYIPEWEDLEAGCACSPRAFSFIRNQFPSNSARCRMAMLEQKARSPTSSEAIGYDVRVSYVRGFLVRIVLFFVYCLLVSLFHTSLGLQCGVPDPLFPNTSGHASLSSGDGERDTGNLSWMKLIVCSSLFYMIAQGYGNMRMARDRMERIQHCCVAAAYSFLKSVYPVSDTNQNCDEEQRLVYECMALCAAYPVAIIQYVRGNTCEPAVARYCREAAVKLRTLRCGGHLAEDSVSTAQYDTATVFSEPGSAKRVYVPVDHFFEVFCCQLEAEYERQRSMTTKSRSLTAVHITYALRCHYENLIDLGAIDDRKGPAIKEAIELMGGLGRELHINTPRDVRPTFFLHTIYYSAWVLSIRTPIDECSRLINSSLIVDAAKPEIPTLSTLFSMLVISCSCGLLLTILHEAWDLWDPFNKSVNRYGWMLGVGMELDAMLNHFYETEPEAMIRKHSYMPSRNKGPPQNVARWVGQQM